MVMKFKIELILGKADGDCYTRCITYDDAIPSFVSILELLSSFIQKVKPGDDKYLNVNNYRFSTIDDSGEPISLLEEELGELIDGTKLQVRFVNCAVPSDLNSSMNESSGSLRSESTASLELSSIRSEPSVMVRAQAIIGLSDKWADVSFTPDDVSFRIISLLSCTVVGHSSYQQLIENNHLCARMNFYMQLQQCRVE